MWQLQDKWNRLHAISEFVLLLFFLHCYSQKWIVATYATLQEYWLEWLN